MIGQKQLIMAGAALAFTAGVFFYGVNRGTVWTTKKFEAKQAELQEQVFDLTENIQERNDEILRIQRERDQLAFDLEMEAIDAPGSSGPGVGTTGGLQRLERRWGPSKPASQ